MEKLKNNILEISKNHYMYLLNIKNVYGIGLGLKTINGVKTSEPCIHVLVENKVNIKCLSSNHIIPKMFMGIKTDVIETGKIKLRKGDSLPEKIRPLQGGYGIIAISGSKFATGTIGCIVTNMVDSVRQFYVLSNNHVLANINSFSKGTAIYQPIKHPVLIKSEDIVANLSKFIPIKFKGKISSPTNYVDAAIAKLKTSNLASNLIGKVGHIKGSAKAVLGEHVKKVGTVSGVTTGTVTTVGVTGIFPINNKVALFKNQIETDIPNKNGDSGSVVLNKDDKAIGLLWFGSDTSCVLNDINLVLKALKVDIYLG